MVSVEIEASNGKVYKVKYTANKYTDLVDIIDIQPLDARQMSNYLLVKKMKEERNNRNGKK